jgi:hypothetical protein
MASKGGIRYRTESNRVCFRLAGRAALARAGTEVYFAKCDAGLLPETIRRRLTKADFSQVFPEALEAIGAKISLIRLQ